MYVECKGLTKKYGDVMAVQGADFGIEKGRLVALLGPSGSGKTTILRMIAGLEKPSSGEILIGEGERDRLCVPVLCAFPIYECTEEYCFWDGCKKDAKRDCKKAGG